MIDRDDPPDDRMFGPGASDPALRERYGAALRAHLDEHLSGAGRGRYVAVGVAGLIGALACGSLAITEPAGLSPQVRGALALLAFVGLAWTLFAAWAVARSRGDYVDQRMLAVRLGFGLTLVTVIALAAISSTTGHPSSGMPLVAAGMAMLILAAVLLIDGRIERSELAIREHLLRIESRLARLSGADAQEGER